MTHDITHNVAWPSCSAHSGWCSAAAAAAVLAAGLPDVGIGYAGVALAFGLTVLTMAYTIGHISGCHLNPAVTIGLWAGGRFPAKDIPLYIVAQVIGATIAAAAALSHCQRARRITCWRPTASPPNGYGAHSPQGYSMQAGFIIEALLTFFFLLVIMGSTDSRAPAGFAPIAIGLALTLIHLISIPVTNTSVNPARSTGPALIQGGWALQQLWLFWVAPIIGGVIGGLVYKVIGADATKRPDITGGPL